MTVFTRWVRVMLGMLKKLWYVTQEGCVCVFACVSLCVHMYSDCDGGGGGCLPVWDSEQRAGGLGMEQRICIDCFCASELFSRCQSCLHQLRGKLQHLHREAFSFLFLIYLYIYLFYNGRCIYNLQCQRIFSLLFPVLAKLPKLKRESPPGAKAVFSCLELQSCSLKHSDG